MANRKLFSLSVATVVLSLQAADCYILLTANLDDFQSIARQIASSPVAHQVHQILRRASTMFNDHINKNSGAGRIHQRAEETDAENNEAEKDAFEIWKPDPNKAEQGPENFRARASDTSDMSAEHNEKKEKKAERRNAGSTDLAELGKNASFYLKSIKKIFEGV
ncbi:unnamed protein product [Chrysodeixis includens]|uniref:Uncharacterized protein n=1 Tax=Chrysodeixis includens TaxID=689277 RepID=A0A9N8L6A6_CHRIL|nr:unnamed protein product [Chrysodeixis includens]